MDELAYSVVRGEVCCLDCHCEVAPPASAAALAYKPPPSPRTPKPEPRARMVERVWAALEERGPVFTLADGTGVLLGWCPACGSGTIRVRVLGDSQRPRLRLEPCSAGCPDAEIAKALR